VTSDKQVRKLRVEPLSRNGATGARAASGATLVYGVEGESGALRPLLSTLSLFLSFLPLLLALSPLYG
jgi:hypothetical protein